MHCSGVEILSDVADIAETVKAFFAVTYEDGMILEPGRFAFKKTSAKAVKIEIDLGSVDCGENTISNLMKYLDGKFDNIKK